MEERECNIKKAMLGGRQLTVTYTETHPEGEKDITVKSEIPAHKDCTNAFKKLVPHFILLTEMKESDRVSHLAARAGIERIPEEDEFKNTGVYGIKLGKNESHVPTVILTGERYLQTGGSVDFSSPVQELESSGGDFEYPYINELNLAVQAVVYEVKAYLFQNKYAITQSEINFEAAPETPIEIGRMIDADTGKVTPIRAGKRPSDASPSTANPAPSRGPSTHLDPSQTAVSVAGPSPIAKPMPSPSRSTHLDPSPATVSVANPSAVAHPAPSRGRSAGLASPAAAAPSAVPASPASPPIPPIPPVTPPPAQKPKRGRRPKCETPTAFPTC